MQSNSAAKQTRISREYLEVGPSGLSFLTAGEGSPMVLLHGIGDSAVDWQWIIPPLAGRYRVYAIDWPGSGESTGFTADDILAFFEKTLFGFLDGAGIRSPILVGNSLGGLIAIRATAAEPSRFPRVVLVDSAGLGREVHPSQQIVARRGVGELGAAWGATPLGSRQRAWLRAELMFHRLQRVPREWLEEQRRLALRPGFTHTWLEVLRAVVNPEGQRQILVGLLARLAMPTLVVWGQRDRIIPLKHGQEAVERIPNGELSIIPNCGHLPQVEQPEQLVRVMLEFLDGLGHAVPQEAASRG